MRCPRCQRELPAGAEECPACGSPTRTDAADRSAVASTEASLAPGTVLGGRYRIVTLAGRGGMGEVYRAEDLKLDQTIALKLLPPEFETDEPRLARLLNEVRTARRVSHPNVCRVYDIGEAEGRHFLSMEWIEGEELASLLSRKGRLGAERALPLARQICAGLAAVHEARILHRDLKPSNVMIDERGVARISDFGLASVARGVRGQEARLGTPPYMSPEQLAGGEVTTRSDLFSLGLVLYELFTGTRAYSGRSLDEITRQHAARPPRPTGIDAGVARIILRCLEADPERRPAGVREVVQGLPGGGSRDEALEAAQQRADRIAAFRSELAELRRAGLVSIGENQLAEVDRYHDGVLKDLVDRYDVDVTERGKQLSLGMRVVSFLGALALAASVFYLFFSIWGLISMPLQITILAGAPVLALVATDALARSRRTSYFAAMIGLCAFACLVVDTVLLEHIVNAAAGILSLLVWGLFALVLAYGYGLWLLLVLGLLSLAGFLGGCLHHLGGGHWPAFLERPENLLPAGVLLFGGALLTRGRHPVGFERTYRLLGLLLLFIPPVLLSMLGFLSYLPFERRTVEIGYELFGFALSAGAIAFGIARYYRESVYCGAAAFVVLLYLKFVDWWWDWMPRWLFFLIVAVTAIVVLQLLKRLRAATEGAR